MHQKRREDLRVDGSGAILGTAGLGLVVAGFIEQPQLGWGDPLIIGAFLGGLACLGAFVAYELRTPMPMLPLRLFRLRNFSVTNIETLSVYGGLSGLSTFLTLYLIEFAGYSALHAGISLLPITIVMFFLSPRMGRLSMQHGPRLFMSLGPILAGVAVLAYTRLPQDVDYWVDIVPALLVFSVGLSMTVAPLTTTVLADAGPGDAGVASGVNNAVARIAGLLAIAILGILAAGGGDHLTVHGFHFDHGRRRRSARLRRPDRRDRDPQPATIGIAYVYARPMPKQAYTATEAARELGISVDTLRRWDREGRIRTEARQCEPPARLPRGDRAAARRRGAQHMSARNRLRGTVSEVRVEGLLAQVELTVTEPARVVAVVTRDAVEELGLKPGMAATAVVKSTSVMVEA